MISLDDAGVADRIAAYLGQHDNEAWLACDFRWSQVLRSDVADWRCYFAKLLLDQLKSEPGWISLSAESQQQLACRLTEHLTVDGPRSHGARPTALGFTREPGALQCHVR